MRASKQLFQFVFLMLIVTVPATGMAVEPDNTFWYEIELIVFEPVEPAVTTEKWPHIIDEPVLDNAVALLPPARPAASANSSPTPFQELDSASLQLKSQVKRLTAGNRYRVLLHTGWRQPLEENGPSTSVYISSLPDTESPLANPEAIPDARGNHVDGVITLSLTRYLHFKSHLVYNNPEVDLARQVIEQDHNTAVIEKFVMKESRRVKRQELHYFDHPYFGMVARVIRYEPPQPGLQPTSQ